MDCSLTNKGREEAYNIKIPFIRSEEIIVFVSPLKRALQTA
jgi:broad specificity phosphatase PhoE